MKATATAPANIAFVKYWGKRDGALRLPLNDSVSMALDAASTVTSVEFDGALAADDITLVGESLTDAERARVVRHLDRVRQRANSTTFARVVTRNDFPRGTGLASSASGFAALSLAAATAAGLTLTPRALSVLAREGSGSAARSIPGGFALWHAAETSEDSYAELLHPHDHWDLRDVIAVVSSTRKKTGSTEGMDVAATSPFLTARLAGIPDTVDGVVQAIAAKDLRALGALVEEESFNMHAVMLTQRPPLVYWAPATVAVFHAVAAWRSEGIAVYVTVDAGPNVHVLCEGADAEAVAARLAVVPGVERTIVCASAPGAHLVEQHLL